MTSRVSPTTPVRRIHEEGILTGEAVALEIRPASPARRAAAGVVDVMTTLLLALSVVVFALTHLESLSPSLARVLGIGMVVTVTCAVPTLVEVATRGRSLGKWAFSLQVLRDDGGPVTARQSFLRALTGVLELWATFGGLALLTMLVTRRAKRLGDMAAGTMVVRIPSPAPRHPLLMPPELAAWAANAQVAPLPEGLRAEARAFLDSTRSMLPEPRTGEGLRLAALCAPFVAPPPPEGTHPERFLAAVLVTLRDREVRRELSRIGSASRRRERARSRRGVFGI